MYSIEDRSQVITIGGEEHKLILTTKATKDITKRYGGLEKLGDKLLKNATMEESLGEVIWLIALLANQEILIHNLQHRDEPKPLLTEDEIELLTNPYELAEYKDAIMAAMLKGTKYVFAGIGGFMGWFLGGLDGFLYALLMFVVIDYATGLMAAFVQKKVSSEVGFKDICKKVAIFCLVGIGHVLDTQVIQNGSVLRTAVIFFYLSNEGISIIENVALIGLTVPKKLKEVLEQLHEEADEKKEDE